MSTHVLALGLGSSWLGPLSTGQLDLASALQSRVFSSIGRVRKGKRLGQDHTGSGRVGTHTQVCPKPTLSPVPQGVNAPFKLEEALFGTPLESSGPRE